MYILKYLKNDNISCLIVDIILYTVVQVLFAFSIMLIVMRIPKPVTTFNHGALINGK